MGNLLEKYQKVEQEMREGVEEQKEVVVSYNEVATIVRLLEEEAYSKEQQLAEQTRLKEHKRRITQQPLDKVDKSSETKEVHLLLKEEGKEIDLEGLVGARLTEQYGIYREGTKVTQEVDELTKLGEKNVGYEGIYRTIGSDEIGRLKAENFTGVVIDGYIKDVSLVQIIRQGLKVYIVKDKLRAEQLQEYKEKLSQLGCELVVTTSM